MSSAKTKSRRRLLPHEERIFLAIWKDRAPEFREVRRHGHILEEMIHDLALQGVIMTKKEITNKMENLKKQYKATKKGLTTGSEAPKWPHWKIMQEIVGDSITVDHSSNFESMPIVYEEESLDERFESGGK